MSLSDQKYNSDDDTNGCYYGNNDSDNSDCNKSDVGDGADYTHRHTHTQI